MPDAPEYDPEDDSPEKLSREENKHKRDDLCDLAGYAECASMVAERQGL